MWTNNTLLKGGVLVALFYWAWFSLAAQPRERKILLTTLLTAPVLVLIARLLAKCLPFRARPLHEENLDFTLPTGISERALDGWSSFPSDHVVLYIGFAVGILAVSRRLGLIAILYTLIFIALPRIYVGYHYPTDILGGLAIAGILMPISIYLFANSFITTRIYNWTKKRPGVFYALFFLTTFQVANLFDESRQIASFLFGSLVH